MIDSRSSSDNHRLDQTRSSSSINYSANHHPPRWKDEIKKMIDLALPTIVVQLGGVLPNFLTASYVGRQFGSLYLDGFTLACLMGNLFNLSLLQGLFTAADTLGPQAFGAGNYQEVGLLAMRGYVASLFVIVPINLVLIFQFDNLLIAVGENPDAAVAAHRWYRIYVIGLPFFSLYQVTWKFLSSQEIMKPLVYVCLLCCGIIFPIALDYSTRIWGFLGSAVAVVVYQISQSTLLLMYLKLVKPHKVETWSGLILWKQALQWVPMKRYFYLGVGGMLATSEWIYWEFLSMMIGTLGVIPLSVHTVPTQVLSVMFMFPLGIGIALAVRLGATLPHTVLRAQQLAVGCYLTSVILFAGMSMLMFVFRQSIFAIFTSEPLVLEGCERIWWKVCVFYFNLSIYGINMGIATGLGKQWMFGIVTVVFLWGLSLPAMYYFAILKDGGLDMAWACIYQPYIAMNVYYFYAFRWQTDWDAARLEIRIRECMDDDDDDNNFQNGGEGEMVESKKDNSCSGGEYVDETTKLL